MTLVLERQTAKLTGGQVMMEALLANGVDTMFGYPGGAIMPTYDALHGYGDRINHILGRHEQGSIHAAEGWARIKGRPGVVLATSGPGALNLVTGLRDALMDSTPLVAITGQVASHLIGTQAFQEANVVDTVFPHNTKWAYQVKNGGEIPGVVNHAFKVAMAGRPGPVLIDIPRDIQLAEVTYTGVNPNGHYPETSLTSEALRKLQDAADLLSRAQKPLILAGHGVLIAKAQEELRQLAEKAGIPVANTLHGLASIPTDHPLFRGMAGMHGRYSINRLTNQADVILAVGMRFDDRVTGRVKDYAKQAKIIHIDVDPTQLNRIVKATIPINADAKSALSVLARKAKNRRHPEWLAEFDKLDQEEYEKVNHRELVASGPELTMAEVVAKLSDKTNGEAIVVADVGQHQMEAAQHSGFRGRGRFLTSGGMGTMGFALPAAIGAKIAAPDTQVVAIAGDGSFQMTMQELGVIMEHKLPVKVMILNNSFLGMVRQWQDGFFKGNRSFVDLVNPEFITLARAYSIPAETVNTREDLSGALDRMLSTPSSYLLDIAVGKEDNVFPMIPPGASVDEVILR